VALPKLLKVALEVLEEIQYFQQLPLLVVVMALGILLVLQLVVLVVRAVVVAVLAAALEERAILHLPHHLKAIVAVQEVETVAVVVAAQMLLAQMLAQIPAATVVLVQLPH
jgi:hypothetical protein